MARGRDRYLCYCVPAAGGGDEIGVPRLAAPQSIATVPLRYRGRVSVEILPDLDDDENRRLWHAKMLALIGDSYTALMIGSSNFTRAGMGAARHWNAEANLVTVVKRVRYGREVGKLEAIWPNMDSVDDLDAAEWLGSQSDIDEEERASAPPVPRGFVSAIYRAGAERAVVLQLAPEHLPSEWSIRACGRDEMEILNARGVVQNWPPVGHYAPVVANASARSPLGLLGRQGSLLGN